MNPQHPKIKPKPHLSFPENDQPMPFEKIEVEGQSFLKAQYEGKNHVDLESIAKFSCLKEASLRRRLFDSVDLRDHVVVLSLADGSHWGDRKAMIAINAIDRILQIPTGSRISSPTKQKAFRRAQDELQKLIMAKCPQDEGSGIYGDPDSPALPSPKSLGEIAKYLRGRVDSYLEKFESRLEALEKQARDKKRVRKVRRPGLFLRNN